NYSLDPLDPNFYPVSSFSDWGSSRSSVAAYTRTPAGQSEDPFEYDKRSSLSSPYPNGGSFEGNSHPASAVPPVLQEDFSEFARAVEWNAAQKFFANPNSKLFIPRIPTIIPDPESGRIKTETSHDGESMS